MMKKIAKIIVAGLYLPVAVILFPAIILDRIWELAEQEWDFWASVLVVGFETAWCIFLFTTTMWLFGG